MTFVCPGESKETTAHSKVAQEVEGNGGVGRARGKTWRLHYFRSRGGCTRALGTMWLGLLQCSREPIPTQLCCGTIKLGGCGPNQDEGIA